MDSANIGDREQAMGRAFRELSEETTRLVRAELELVRSELGAQLRRLAPSSALLAAAGLLAFGAFGAATGGLVSVLGARRPARGAFAVAAIYGAGAGALIVVARHRLRQAAPQAIETIRRDVDAAAAGARAADED